MDKRFHTFNLSSRVLCSLILITAVFSFLVVSCASSEQPQASVVSTPSLEVTAIPSIPAAAVDHPSLSVWIPTNFLVTHQKQVLDLFNEETKDFLKANPGVEIEFRTRDDILNWLSLTNRAAPTGLPDLVLVDRDTLEIASLKGLLHPINGQFDMIQWESNILQTGMIQGTQFGLPVVADALVLFTKKDVKATTDLTEIFHSSDRLALDLSDPRNSMVLSVYLSLGGQVEDAAGRPTLDAGPLRQTLELIQAGRESGAISTQQNTHPYTAETWLDFVQRDTVRWIGWYSQFPDEIKSNGSITALPPLSGGSVRSIGDGWYWAVSNPDPTHNQLATELLIDLTKPQLLERIADTSGWLSVNQSSTGGLIAVPPIQTRPDGLILVTISPVLQDSVLRVLSGESAELVANQTAALFK